VLIFKILILMHFFWPELPTPERKKSPVRLTPDGAKKKNYFDAPEPLPKKSNTFWI
jgi:hypothetical protein